MEPYGSVERICIYTNPTGMVKGYAHVEFSLPSAAAKALEDMKKICSVRSSFSAPHKSHFTIGVVAFKVVARSFTAALRCVVQSVVFEIIALHLQAAAKAKETNMEEGVDQVRQWLAASDAAHRLEGFVSTSESVANLQTSAVSVGGL
jgi:RNA recognition motif-containing protein